MWLLGTCVGVETKEEYDRSHVELSKFLALDETVDAIGKDCIAAVSNLQDSLRTKESELAGYHRHTVKNCMDASTTSPAEANNSAIKRGSFGINAKMNLDKSTKRLLRGVNGRLQRRRNKARREVYKTNNASRAPTKDYLIQTGQALIDQNYDNRLNCKSAQIGPEDWLVWNFLETEKEIKCPIQLYLPKFLRVRQLTVNEHSNGKCFVPCDCHYRTRVGVPCECFFNIAHNANIPEEEIVDIGMVDVRYLKLYNANYGDDTDLGRQLCKAQEQCFLYEKEGTQISEAFKKKLVGDDDTVYPILGENTSQEDFDEAMFVLNRPTTTLYDLAMHRMEEDSDSDMDDIYEIDDSVTLNALGNGEYERVSMSVWADKMKSTLAESQKECMPDSNQDSGLLPTSMEMKDRRNQWGVELDKILIDQRGSKEAKDRFNKDFNDSVTKYWDEVNKNWGKRGGGEGRMELAGETVAFAKTEGRYRSRGG